MRRLAIAILACFLCGAQGLAQPAPSPSGQPSSSGDEFYANPGANAPPGTGVDVFSATPGGGPMYGNGQYGRDPECGGTDRSYYNKLYNSTAIVLSIQRMQDLYRQTHGQIWIRCGVCRNQAICWPRSGYQQLIAGTAAPVQPQPQQAQSGPSCQALPQDPHYSPMGLADIRQASPEPQYIAGLLKGYAACQEDLLKSAPVTAAVLLAAQKWRLAARAASLFCRGAAVASVVSGLMASAQPGETIYDVGIRDGRTICATVVAAQALRPSGEPSPANQNASTAATGRGIWAESANQRGLAIENALGGNLPPGFPTIDGYAGSPATPTGITSIKSVDLTTPGYQRPGAVLSVLRSYTASLARFTGATRGGVTVTPAQGTQRTLLVAIPPDPVSAQQLSELAQAQAQARAQGITLDIRTFP